MIIEKSVAVERTARVAQLEGLFDLPLSERSHLEWEVDLPIGERPWQIGLIVGPSGCGKSTIAREIWGDAVCQGFAWPAARSVVDGFPPNLGIQEITGLLSSVGFSSPPSWVRPFGVLSNGEQFRATLARALAEQVEGRPVVIDEFTSVVDRKVAKVGAAAVAKAVRRRPGCQLVAVSCHDDVVPWLCPDWVYEPAVGCFQWVHLQRPNIDLVVRRARASEWRLFRAHHYLSGNHAGHAYCFLGSVEGEPAAWSSWIYFPAAKGANGYREHRTVCLPDYQGVGIGNAMSDYCAGIMQAITRGVIRSVTSAPGMIAHRCRSGLWRMLRRKLVEAEQHNGMPGCKAAGGRVVASFVYRGVARVHEARAFGLRVKL